MELQLEYFKSIIEEIVRNISIEAYEVISLNKQMGRVDAKDLKRVIAAYGCTIIPLPEEAFSMAEVYDVKDKNRLDVFIPLWTREEGRSDLTLSLSCCIIDRMPKVVIDDLNVL